MSAFIWWRHATALNLAAIADGCEEWNQHENAETLRGMARRIGKGLVTINRRGEVKSIDDSPKPLKERR